MIPKGERPIMILPKADELAKFNAYALVLAAAKRANQLHVQGIERKALIKTDSRNVLTVALEEIASGRIVPTLKEVQALPPEAYPDYQAQQQALAESEAALAAEIYNQENADIINSMELLSTEEAAAAAAAADMEDPDAMLPPSEFNASILDKAIAKIREEKNLAQSEDSMSDEDASDEEITPDDESTDEDLN